MPHDARATSRWRIAHGAFVVVAMVVIACGAGAWALLVGEGALAQAPAKSAPASRPASSAPPAQGTPLSDTAPPQAPIQLAGEIDLARLVDLTAQRLGLRVEYDAAALTGKVTLRVPGALGNDELWALTNHALAARGLTTVRRGVTDEPGSGTVSIVKIADAAALTPTVTPTATASAVAVTPPGAVPPPSTLAAAPFQSGFATIVIRAQRRSARELAEALKVVLTKNTGSATVLGNSDLLAISDLSDRVEEAKKVIALLDQPAEPVIVTEVPVRNLSASALSILVAQVVAKRDVVAGTSPTTPVSATATTSSISIAGGATGGDRTPGDVLPSPNGSAVLVIAPQRAIETWRALIEQLDRREGVETRTYTPRFFSAKEVGRLIEQTMKEGGTTPSSASTGAPAADERFKVVIDDLTGTLIITATATQHQRVSALIERLNSAEVSTAKPVRAFSIRNRPVGEIVNTLSQLISAGVLEGGAPETVTARDGGVGSQRSMGASQPFVPSAMNQSSPATTSSPAGGGVVVSSPASTSPLLGEPGSNATASMRRSGTGTSPALSITADEGTNTLIAIGEQRLLAHLESLIKLLDVRQPQIMLEATLVSLSEGDALNLGIELEKLGNLGDAAYRLSSLFGLSGPLAGSPPVRSVADAAGFTGAVLSPGDYSVIVKALQNLNSGRSSTMPKVLVNNNQRAVFSSVLQQPVSTNNILSSTGANAITSTSFAGTQDAGTTISVRPQIAEGDHLVLEYSISLSSFVGASAGPGLPPPRQQNKVDSVATIPDGHTVVVGGLEVLQDGENIAQIPLLGQVPIVGELFKKRDKSKSKTRFYVFIRSTVLRSNRFEDLKFLSESAAASVGVESGWPVVEARFIR